MNFKNRTAFCILATIGISAIGVVQAKEPTQTVDWFKTHENERKAQLAQCDNNPGELAKTPNCVNAKRAKQSLVWSSDKGVGPVAPLTAEDFKKGSSKAEQDAVWANRG